MQLNSQNKNILMDSVFPLGLNFKNYFSLESLAYLGNNSKSTLDASFILYTGEGRDSKSL